jgi:hypothetical protein
MNNTIEAFDFLRQSFFDRSTLSSVVNRRRNSHRRRTRNSTRHRRRIRLSVFGVSVSVLNFRIFVV